jgi:hypothetical protein
MAKKKTCRRRSLNQLAEMVFSAPSSIMLFVIVLVVAAPMLILMRSATSNAWSGSQRDRGAAHEPT